MGRFEKKGARVFGLFLLGCILFNYPILSLFNREIILFGLPLLYLYLFGIWVVLIILTSRDSNSRQQTNIQDRPRIGD